MKTWSWNVKGILGSRRAHYLARLGIFLIAAALAEGMVGCGPSFPPLPPSQNLEIRDWHDLNAIRDNLTGHHILMNDLDSTTAGYTELASPTANQGKGWEPIGTLYIGLRGTFDGQGYEIRDLFIDRPDKDYVGLFGDVDRGAIIKDIGVVNFTMTGEVSVGGVVGTNWGTISNAYCTGNVAGDGSVGGLAGGNSPGGVVSNSNFTGSVTGGDNVGGLLGTNSDGSVSDCYSTGNVTGHSFVGGLVGKNPFDAAAVSNSYSTCSVAGYESVGGLVGYNYQGTVSDCYATGSVTGNSSIGGLVGENRLEGTVSNSYSIGSVTGNSTVGGLVGLNSNGTVSNSFWDIGTSGQATSAGGTGKSTAQMKDIATFSGARWKIIGVADGETNSGYIWNIVEGESYPFLSWQL
jgi:hypothetical protein